MITLAPYGHGTSTFIVSYSGNGKELGEIAKADDGYWVYWPDDTSGYYSANLMHAIAAKLDDMNYEWDQQIRREIGGE